MSLVWEFSKEIFSPTRPPCPRWKAVPPLVTDGNSLFSPCFCTLCIHTLQASHLPCKYRCGPADLQLLWAEDVYQSAEAALPLALLLSVSAKSPPEESKQPGTSNVTLLHFHLSELNVFRHKKVRWPHILPCPCSDPFGRQGRNSGAVIGGKKDHFLAKIARWWCSGQGNGEFLLAKLMLNVWAALLASCPTPHGVGISLSTRQSTLWDTKPDLSPLKKQRGEAGPWEDFHRKVSHTPLSYLNLKRYVFSEFCVAER